MNLTRDAAELTPQFAELLRCRGIREDRDVEIFLYGGLGDLHDPFRMKGMGEAVLRIQSAARESERVLIHGDYDADGITASALLASTLNILEIPHKVFLPDRKEDGYGVSGRAVRKAIGDGFRLLITVDCGITAFRQIEEARRAGLDVIIIDHHHIPENGLPPATVILNPYQDDCGYPFKDLSAGGLVFKLAEALLGAKAYDFLDLAAVSTVCDLAPLVGENRILVREGLKKLTANPRLGFRALAEVAGIGNREVNAGHIGFVFGPRINAAGRMSSPDIALRLLMTENHREVGTLASVLHEENRVRQREEKQVVRDALREIERTVNFNREKVIVVAKQGWHQGVIGIAASRIAEKYHRPAVVISLDGETGKGSARSIKTLNLYDILMQAADLFVEFGGHAQAAGLSIREDQIPLFRQRVNEYAAEHIPAEAFVRRVKWDMEVELKDLSTVFVRELQLLEPFGIGNPKPLFLTRNLEIKTKPAALTPQTTRFYVTGGNLVYEVAVYESEGAGQAEIALGLMPKDFMDLVYFPKLKQWQGQDRLVLEAKNVRPVESI